MERERIGGGGSADSHGDDDDERDGVWGGVGRKSEARRGGDERKSDGRRGGGERKRSDKHNHHNVAPFISEPLLGSTMAEFEGPPLFLPHNFQSRVWFQGCTPWQTFFRSS